MKITLSLIIILFSLLVNAQDNLIFNAEKKSLLNIGKYHYVIDYEYNYQPENKIFSFSEILVKGNKKQYIAHFVYQLKNTTEMQINPDNPPPIQIENRILQSYSLLYERKKEQILVTTYFYDMKEPKEKEIKTLQQSKNGFFYVKEKQTYFKNGKLKEEKELTPKIEFYKIPF